MKGLTKIIFAVIACAIVSIVILYLVIIAKESYFTKSLELLRRFKTYKPYVFDINDLLVDPNDSTVFDATNHSDYYEKSNDPPFCKDLRNCIESIIKGQQCVITYKVKPGVTFSPDNITDSLLNHCLTTDIKEELYGGTGRKVCKFKHDSIVNYNKFSEDNISLIDYEPYIHNCYLPDNLGSYNVLNDVDSINYLYSGRGTESSYDFENGGTVRIVVTNVSIVNDFDATCSYSLYVCGQNAIAAKENETPVYVFREIQNLGNRVGKKGENELYYNETIVWAGTPEADRQDVTLIWFWNNIIRQLICVFSLGAVCPGPLPYPLLPPGYNLYGYNPRTYEFNFNGTCSSSGTCDKALIDAIDAGMWEWNKVNYADKESTKYFRSGYCPYDMPNCIDNAYFSYSPIDTANIIEDPTLSFNSYPNCWNLDYENSNVGDRTELIFNGNVLTDSKSLYHIFNFNSFTIGDRIRMVLGIKKIFITRKPIHYDISLLGLAIGSWDTTMLDEVNNNYEPHENLYPRVILVMDPVTFCSSKVAVCSDSICNVAGGECDTCPADCTIADCCGNGICNAAVGENSANCPGDCHCPDGICDPGEICPADDNACLLPAVCYSKRCDNGCNPSPIALGSQDSGRCDNTQGCASPPCVCDGSGNCISGACTCSDGTSCDSCSSNKPKYCDSTGTLVDDCWSCECPNPTDVCNLDGTCSPSIYTFISPDVTCAGLYPAFPVAATQFNGAIWWNKCSSNSDCVDVYDQPSDKYTFQYFDGSHADNEVSGSTYKGTDLSKHTDTYIWQSIGYCTDSSCNPDGTSVIAECCWTNSAGGKECNSVPSFPAESAGAKNKDWLLQKNYTSGDYGILNDADFYDDSLSPPMNKPYSKFRKAWCGDENINCLLCEADWIHPANTAWYVCGVRYNPLGDDPKDYNIHTEYPDATITIIDSFGNIRRWNCKADGNWERV